jgi:tRNA (guanine9-N1)-methyltransferase
LNAGQRLCADKAERLGIKTARLPIDPTRLIGSTVLTVNGVVNILLTYNETLDWEKTFDRSLPKRKVKAVEALPDDDDEEERYNNRPAM